MMIRKFGNFIGYLAIFLFILSFAIAFVINFTPLYHFEISFLNIEEMTGLSKDILVDNYRILINYLNVPWIEELSMPNFPSSENGLFHFYEVKKLFQLDYVILLITAVFSFFFIKEKRKGRVWEMVLPLQIMAILPNILLFFIFVNFNRLFVLFHEIFFNNDAWIFDAQSDPIILALPQDFFMHCFVLVFLILEITLWALYIWAKRKTVK